MNNNYFYLHIGESTWDVECINFFNIKTTKTYLHNDYFQKKTVNNHRTVKLIKIFFLVLIAFFKNEKIIFSSINSESMLTQILFIFYKKCYFFILNVCGYKKESHIGAKIYRFLINRYSSRVIISDQVTYQCLKSCNPTPTENLFTLSKLKDLPKKAVSNFIVVLPAPETHKDSLKDIDLLYNFHIDIFNFFYTKNIKVFLLPHPRDRGHTIKKLKENNVPLDKIIRSDKIRELDNVIYISGFSSLCLNKRYGGKYGIWVSINDKNILKNEFKECKNFLINIEDLS